MEYLKKEDIFLINQGTIEVHGGNFMAPNNLVNPGALDYLIEMVSAKSPFSLSNLISFFPSQL